MVLSHSKLKRKRKEELAALVASGGAVADHTSSVEDGDTTAAGEKKKKKDKKQKKQKTNFVSDAETEGLTASKESVGGGEGVQISKEIETKDRKILRREKKEAKKRRKAGDIDTVSHIPPSEENGVHNVENRADETASNSGGNAEQPIVENGTTTAGTERPMSVREKKGKKKIAAKDRWGVKVIEEDGKDAIPVEIQAVKENPFTSTSAEELYDLKKVYVGGFPYYCTEDDIHDYFSECGVITELDCMTFPDTGNFRGIAFITFKECGGFSFIFDRIKSNGHNFLGYECAHPALRYGYFSIASVKRNGLSSGVEVRARLSSKTVEGAAKALEYDGADMGGRFLKIVKCKVKPRANIKDPDRGEVRKTPGSKSAYIGNLSWDVAEDVIKNFFKKSYTDCKIDAVRLAFDKVTGDFKGFGHVDFGDDESLEAAVKLNQMPLLGRPMKIAYSVPPKQSAVNGRTESRSTGTCYNCGGEGHKAFLCPKKGVNANDEFDTKKVAACYSCGEEGHKSFLCPKKEAR